MRPANRSPHLQGNNRASSRASVAAGTKANGSVSIEDLVSAHGGFTSGCRAILTYGIALHDPWCDGLTMSPSLPAFPSAEALAADVGGWTKEAIAGAMGI